MFLSLLEFFKRLFRVKPKTTYLEQAINGRYASNYESITTVNLTAILAQRLANMAVTDSTIEVLGNNARAEFLNKTLKDCAAKLRNITSRQLGVGGVVLKPSILGEKIHTDVIAQNRFFVVSQSGEEITKGGFIAEVFDRDSNSYVRTEYHTLDENGVYTIEQKATIDEHEIELSSVPEWAGLEPIIKITGVKQMLFSFIKCPTDSRRQFDSIYGVPITYGNEKLMSEIVDLWDELQKELKNKGVFVGISDLLFNKNNELPDEGVFKMFTSDTKLGQGHNFFETYSPDIREQSYINAINHKLELLEKAVGVNKGILTNLDTADATATAIRRSTFDTWSLVDAVRGELEAGLTALVYAYDVIANVNELVPQGEYEVAFDWDYSLLEDSAETFNQYLQAVGAGWLKPEEGRAWLMNEDIETAKLNLPETEQLLRAE